MTQGGRANANGKIFEEQLVPLFSRNGYIVIKYSEWKADEELIANIEAGTPKKKAPKRYRDEQKLVICQYPFNSIYEHIGKTEFLIINKPKERVIRVECKWQQDAGSVDEKFPYMYLNCIYGYEEAEIILIVDGGGYKPGARAWLEKVIDNKWLIDEKNPKAIRLMTISEFTAYFNRHLA